MTTRRASSVSFKIVAILVVVAIGLIAYYVVSPENSPPENPDTLPPKEIPTHWTGKGNQEVIFPVQVRSDNDEVNRFIYDFLKLLLDEDYKGYRLRVTRRREPVDQRTFKQAYEKVKLIRVNAVEALADGAQIKDPELKGCQPPIYRVKVYIALTTNVERDIELYIFQEDGRWVSSH